MAGLTAALILVISVVPGTAAPTRPPEPEPTVTPARVQDALDPGGSLTVDKRVRTPVVPPRPDVVLLVDGTGSMDRSIGNIQDQLNLITDAVTREQDDARFAVATYGDAADGERAYQVLQGLTDDLDAVKRGVGKLTADLGNFSPSEDWINALWQVANNGEDGTAFRDGASPVVVLVGDASSHDPSLGHTLTEAVNALQSKGARILAVDIDTPVGDGLNGNGDNGNGQPGEPTHEPNQATKAVDATGGKLFEGIDSDRVADTIAEGLSNLPTTVSHQILACHPSLTVTLEPATRTVTSGETAAFKETIKVAEDAPQGAELSCGIQFLVDGKVPGGGTPDTVIGDAEARDSTFGHSTGGSGASGASGGSDAAGGTSASGGSDDAGGTSGSGGTSDSGGSGEESTAGAVAGAIGGSDGGQNAGVIGGLIGSVTSGAHGGAHGGANGGPGGEVGGPGGDVGGPGGGVGGPGGDVGGPGGDVGGPGGDVGGPGGEVGGPGGDTEGPGGDTEGPGGDTEGPGGGDGGDDDPVPAYQQRITISVNDVEAPQVVVDDRTVEATGKDGAKIDFTAAAVDAVDGRLPATCDHASGSLFPLGATTVTCSATDSAGNKGTDTATFKVVPAPVPNEADLAVLVNIARERTYTGRAATAVFTITNTGPKTAKGVVLSTSWPRTADAAKRSVGRLPGCTDSDPCTIAPGKRLTVTQQAVYRTAVNGDVTVSVRGTPRDPKAGNNKASARLRVLQPKFTITPEVGPPGQTVVARGKDFPPGSTVRLTWQPGITAARSAVRVGRDGTFEAQVLVLRKDRLGPRVLRAEVGGLEPLRKPFLAVQRNLEPPDFRGRS
ncbi:VWA domain-containing protein [Streptomyces sp. P1-3]|uniref:VWA domain-containing protein n=1 Tax=Streptomyces sp. P1-3 TaxID=3421658 RepID=UPI003D36A673